MTRTSTFFWRAGGLAAVLCLHGGAIFAALIAARADRTGEDQAAPVLEAVFVDDEPPTPPSPNPVVEPEAPPPDPQTAEDPAAEAPSSPQPPEPAPPPEPNPVPPPPDTPQQAVPPPDIPSLAPPPPPPVPKTKLKTAKPKAAHLFSHSTPPRQVPAVATTPTVAIPSPSAAPEQPTPAATVHEPAAITCRKPVYPTEARQAGETGTVELKLRIDVDGAVIDRVVTTSSGYPVLDEAAIEALARCKFRPGTVDGHSEAQWTRLRYVWKLD